MLAAVKQCSEKKTIKYCHYRALLKTTINFHARYRNQIYLFLLLLVIPHHKINLKFH